MPNTQAVTVNGELRTFRAVISNKDLIEAVADGFATVVEHETYPREGKASLVQISYTTRNFEARSVMLTSKATARKVGIAI